MWDMNFNKRYIYIYAFCKISKSLYIVTDLFSIESENINTADTYRIIIIIVIIKLPRGKNDSVYREITFQMTVDYILFSSLPSMFHLVTFRLPVGQPWRFILCLRLLLAATSDKKKPKTSEINKDVSLQ